MGGAAYIAGVVSQTNITNNIFHSNSANKSSLGLERGGGGALYLDGGVTQINGSIFKQNSASGYGGGLVYKHKSLASGTCHWVHVSHSKMQCSLSELYVTDQLCVTILHPILSLA